MEEIEIRTVHTNGIEMHLVVAGAGTFTPSCDLHVREGRP